MEEIEMDSPSINLDDVVDMEDVEVERFADNRGFNLQLIAAEKGHMNAVKNLINRGFEFDGEVDGHLPVELAFENKHFDVVLNLLKANSRFPVNYDCEIAPDELKEFTLISCQLHESINEENEEKIVEIFKENPSLRHFYNLENKSAIQVAIESKKFKIYKILIAHKIYIGPHEDIDVLMKSLSRSEQRELREIHASMSSSIISKPMMTLAKNSFIGPDIPDQIENLNFINEAYYFLFQIPLIAIILKVVAAARKFKIIFDFKRDSVTFLDPSAEPYTNGLFYTSRKIFIAAKNLLDPDRKFEVHSVIAHELCHFAMFLVYENRAKPYFEKNEKGKIIFDKAIEWCKNSKFNLVQLLFESYPPTMHSAELIVKAPQIIVLYQNNQEAFDDKKKELEPLFDFYENCAMEMEKALPKIKAKNLSKNQKKILRQRKIIIALSVILVLFLFMALLLGLFLYNPQYTWKDLSDGQKINLNNSTVLFHGIEVKFCDLFANDSEVYLKLNSDEITKALKGDASLLNANIKSLYDPFIFLNWSNMTKGLREKFLTLNVTFQGQALEIKKILPKRHSVLKLLSVTQIKQQFNGNPFKISSTLNARIKFFVERSFVNEDEGLPEEESQYELYEIIKFENITEEFKDTFLLSSLAGEGKSTTYRHFWFRLKEKYPWKWVEFVDLKKHFDAYKIGNKTDLTTAVQLSNFLSDHLLKLNKFEKEIFHNLFMSGNAIFLWDGIDEISPFYTDFMLNLAQNVKNQTKNFQFLSTRPQHSQKYQKALDIEAYKLVPLRKSERLDFLVRSVASETLNFLPDKSVDENFKEYLRNSLNNTEEEFLKFEEIVDRGQKILDSIENSSTSNDFVTNPLLIRMIAEIITDDETEIEENLNFYTLYETFIKKKIIEVDEKGKLGQETKARLEANAFNIMELHQAIILSDIKEFILMYYDVDISDLKIMKRLRHSKFSYEDLNRYGIVSIISKDDVNFIHRTFMEFFISQFLINNLDEVNETKKETILTLVIFNFVWMTKSDSSVMKQFIKSYVSHEVDPPLILKYLETEELIMKDIKEIVNGQKLLFIFSFLNFADFYEENYGVPLKFNRYHNFFINPEEKFEDVGLGELIDKWDDLKNYFGEKKFKKIFKLRSNDYGSILHNFANSMVLRKEFYEKLNETFNQKENFDLISLKNQNNITFPMLVFVYQNMTEIKVFWNFVESISNLNQRKELLTTKNHKGNTILQFSTLNNDKSYFIYAKELYEEYFNESSIRELISNVKADSLPAVIECVYSESNETCVEVANYLSELFKDHKDQLRYLLSHRTIEGETIFSFFKFITESKKITIFEDLLNSTFTEDQGNFDGFLEELGVSTKLEIFFKNFTTEDLIERKIKFESNEFSYLTKNWNKIQKSIGEENFKLFLMGRNFTNATLLNDLVENADGQFFEPFFEKLGESLSEEEVKLLILDYRNILNMAILFERNLMPIKAIWEFLAKYLTENELKSILSKEDDGYDNALRNSMISPESNEIFLFLKNIYNKYFSKAQIKKMFLKRRIMGFIERLIQRTKLEKFKEALKYIMEIFKDDMEKFRKLLNFEQYQFNPDQESEINKKFEILKKLKEYLQKDVRGGSDLFDLLDST